MERETIAKLVEGIENPYRDKRYLPGAIDLSCGFETCRRKVLYLLGQEDAPLLECESCGTKVTALHSAPNKRGLYCLTCVEMFEDDVSREVAA